MLFSFSACPYLDFSMYLGTSFSACPYLHFSMYLGSSFLALSITRLVGVSRYFGFNMYIQKLVRRYFGFNMNIERLLDVPTLPHQHVNA